MDASPRKRDLIWILNDGQDFKKWGGSRRMFQDPGRCKQRSKAGVDRAYLEAHKEGGEAVPGDVAPAHGQ